MDLIFLYRPDAYLAAIVTTMFLAGLFLLLVNKRQFGGYAGVRLGCAQAAHQRRGRLVR